MLLLFYAGGTIEAERYLPFVSLVPKDFSLYLRSN